MTSTHTWPNSTKISRNDAWHQQWGKANVISNKYKLMRWIQKGYENIMGGEERDLDGKVKHSQDLLKFTICFTDRNGDRKGCRTPWSGRNTPTAKEDSDITCEIVHKAKTLISVFQEFSASINKVSFWHGDWALGYYSLEFRHFTDIS